jgi:hypothetical protein
MPLPPRIEVPPAGGMPVYGVSLASFQHLSSNGSGRERLMRVYSTLWAWAEIGAFPDNHVNGRRRVHRFFTATFFSH